MKRKIFSKLLMVALVIAAVSSFVSCKDYDDDINNLQNQINKAALQSELAALQQTVANNATAAKAAADAAEAAAKKYADELAAKSTAKADDLEKLIAQVKAVADAAATKDDLGKVEEIAKAAATQAALTEAIADLNGAIEKVKAVADAAATKEELAKAQEELKAAIKKVEDAAAEAKTLAQKAQDAADKAQATADKANTDLAAEVTRAKEAEKKLEDAIKKALEDAKKYTDDALTAAKAYTDDEVEKAAAKAADDLAKAIAKVYTKTEVDALIADAKTAAAADAATKLAAALGDLGTATVKDYVNTQIGSEVADLKEELADTYLTKADFEKITGVSGSLTASVNALYKAVTGLELFGTYSGAGRVLVGYDGDSLEAAIAPRYYYLPLYSGKITEASKFGDENHCATVEVVPFAEGDIVFKQGLIVRVNPVSADLTSANIILVNSKGEALDDYIVAKTPERYDELITTTRATKIETGLWRIPFEVKEGIDRDDLKAMIYTENQWGDLDETGAVLYAVAINNTEEAEDRFVASTYDVALDSKDYVPGTSLYFEADKKSVLTLRNRWKNGLVIDAEQDNKAVNPANYLYPELKWVEGEEVPQANPDLDAAYEADGYTTDYLTIDDTDYRSVETGQQYKLLPVKADVPFTISNVTATNGTPNSVAYYYVTLDCHNAIESAPSEINAWNSYSYEGLNTIVPGSQNLAITISDGAKSKCTGDIIGFRLYAVNYDGTLVDPDGKAFYVLVGESGISGEVNVEYTATNKSYDIDNFTSEDVKDATDNVSVETAVDASNFKKVAISEHNISQVLTISKLNAQTGVDYRDRLAEDLNLAYVLLDKDKNVLTDGDTWDKIAFIKVTVENPGAQLDESTVTFTIEELNATTGAVDNTLTVNVKKILPGKTSMVWRTSLEPKTGTTGDTLYVYPMPSMVNALTNNNTLYSTASNITKQTFSYAGDGDNVVKDENTVWDTDVVNTENCVSGFVDLAGYANGLKKNQNQWIVQNVAKPAANKAYDKTITIDGTEGRNTSLQETEYDNFDILVHKDVINSGATFDTYVTGHYAQVSRKKMTGEAVDYDVKLWEGKIIFADAVKELIIATNRNYYATPARPWAGQKAANFNNAYEFFCGAQGGSTATETHPGALYQKVDTVTAKSAATFAFTKYMKVDEDDNVALAMTNDLDRQVADGNDHSLDSLFKAQWKDETIKTKVLAGIAGIAPEYVESKFTALFEVKNEAVAVAEYKGDAAYAKAATKAASTIVSASVADNAGVQQLTVVNIPGNEPTERIPAMISLKAKDVYGYEFTKGIDFKFGINPLTPSPLAVFNQNPPAPKGGPVGSYWTDGKLYY